MKKPTPTVILLERWHDGDESALHQLLEEEMPWFRAHVKKRLGAELRQLGEAEDYVQEALTRILRTGPRFRVSDRDKFRGLLAVLIENTLRDQSQFHHRERRDPKRLKTLPPDSVLDLDPPQRGVPRPSTIAAESEETAWLELSMELLPATDCQVVRLRTWDGMSFGEIGSALEMQENTARMRYHRALAKMAQIFVQLRDGGLGAVLAARDVEPTP